MKLLIDSDIKQGTKVFIRCDLDVPIKDGKIVEYFRLEAALPTLKFVIDKGAIPIIAGHIGKPGGQEVAELSTNILRPYFDEQLGKDNYELLENLRFDPGEKDNNEKYAKDLAEKAGMFVNESFATCHREHASIVGVPKYIPGYAGLRLQKEVSTLSNLLKDPHRPFVVLIGGAKLESKMPVVSKFLSIADYVLLGGRLGLEWKEEVPENLVIPSDYAQDEKDIGHKTIQDFVMYIQMSKTILWAGPMGMYEEPQFSTGTDHIAKAVHDETSHKDTYSVIGGGDTIAAAQKVVDINGFSFVSTGGGAMLNYFVNGTLPGIEALE